ncbi:MAG: hypothetical protein ALECFALPRED_000791 [Alectoria fallacina]|uniref:C2H2-type domain-containing protein n=1 Tax=Alectoria fallacina TaxID=1903189 RepID=A0A8H3IKE3_9LECA|nr:MAG: hypothetical protein ALECFALPRED_000791 [Alectoria fallacina]
MDHSKLPHLRGSNKQQAQATIVDGKIKKAVNAEPRSNLPSNVHGYPSHDTSGRAWSGNRSGNLPSNVRGPSVVKPTPTWNEYAGEASSSKASIVRQRPDPQRSWDEYAGQASSSQVSSVRQQPDPQTSHQNMSPPHLPKKSAVTTQPPKPTPPMNAGKLAKSAKHDSKVPCTYEDCTRGFTKETDMKRHKDEDHEWCRLCNVDCVDDEALLEHKVQSDMHICCDFCGEDFRSDKGKERHMRQNHAKLQEVKCPACHAVFDKGSALIDHIYNNRCRDRRGFIAEKVNQNILREYRAAAALHLDAISHRPSTIGAEIAAMQPQSERGTSFVDNSEGGVRLNLMDDDIVIGHLTARDLSRAGDLDPSDVESTNASDGTDRPTFDDDEPGLPGISGDMSKGNVPGGGVIEGLQALRLEPSAAVPSGKQAWTAKLFPGAKPTPVIGGWSAPTSPDYRRNILPSESGTEYRIRTDWDNLALERDTVDDTYHCPFSKCPETYNDLNQLKMHLASGFHQGTDHRCLKCLKVFKSPAALTAHMESSSERCKIRETNAYGHVLHVVSGGFLKVTGRHADGSLKVEAPTMEEIEEQMKNEVLPPHLDNDYPW